MSKISVGVTFERLEKERTDIPMCRVRRGRYRFAVIGVTGPVLVEQADGRPANVRGSLKTNVSDCRNSRRICSGRDGGGVEGKRRGTTWRSRNGRPCLMRIYDQHKRRRRLSLRSRAHKLSAS